MAEGGGGGDRAKLSLKSVGAALMASAAIEKAAAPPSSVTVAVRVRPQNQRERGQREANCVEIGADGHCAIGKPGEEGQRREFFFDYAYGDDTEQVDVYTHLGAPILAKAFQGWNGTIFAYGQTGSGKSFSMTGTADKRGIIPQMNDDMFRQVGAISAAEPERKFLVTCSFLEIYNEVLYDLLDPAMRKGTSKDKKTAHLDIHEHPSLGVYVAGLQEIAVDSAAKISSLMDQGNEMRAVAATNMNATSSRSHSIFIIRLLQQEVVAGQQKDTRATINLVDLAGSERQAKTGAVGDKLKSARVASPIPPPWRQPTPARVRSAPREPLTNPTRSSRARAARREGANINKSLSALGAVINALAEQCKNPKKKARAPRAAGRRPRAHAPPRGCVRARASSQLRLPLLLRRPFPRPFPRPPFCPFGRQVFIPYRNSKLTRVLQESLGGNSVTVMLAALSPAAYNYDETLNTLQSERARPGVRTPP